MNYNLISGDTQNAMSKTEEDGNVHCFVEHFDLRMFCSFHLLQKYKNIIFHGFGSVSYSNPRTIYSIQDYTCISPKAKQIVNKYNVLIDRHTKFKRKMHKKIDWINPTKKKKRSKIWRNNIPKKEQQQ